jgi:GntR family transcriptional regulator
MHTQEQVLDALRIGDTGVPIYVQLREQFLQAMGSGALTPGAQMPTMRQVAVALRIDLNTVRRAYDELERLGALRLERGRGSFVAKPPPPKAGSELEEEADRLAAQVLATARAAGVDPLRLAERIAALAAAKES